MASGSASPTTSGRLLEKVTLPRVSTPKPGTQIPGACMWSSAAAETAITTSGDLDQHRTNLHVVPTSAGAVIGEGAQISHSARTQLRIVETACAADKTAVGPDANTPEDKAALPFANCLMAL